MKNLKSGAWWSAAGTRALRTFAQTAVSMIPVAVSITEVSWGALFGTAALAAAASLLTSLAGLPECGEEASR